ncbi:hypothetical protein M8C21_008780 [Ambrosia artemisiifolia]|uniref:Protein NRT1/ PTR FAMILY 6.4 n=1 Tax=Ambrosia artemisiifolia TaxID=4212 RepID=A0AAD5BTI9_AMBAR|nr:hypothetical protein M8C21_008780 [Ambrosia artemisiifolia]
MVLAISKTNHDGAVDFRGNPVDNSKTGGWLAAGLILGTELSERICVMGISMNLVTYLVGDLNLSSSRSANIVTNFMGALNILALFGGFLADSKLGRFLTIAIFASICAIGVTLLTLATAIPSMKPPRCDHHHQTKQQCIEASGSQLAMLYVALSTIALGGSGIKSNVSGFGSDQFDISNPKEEKAMVYFFNRFYFCVSLGSLFAVTILVYIQDEVGRGWGYGISAGTMIVAVVVLICGIRIYRYKKPQGSPLTVIWRVVFLAIKNRKHPYPANPGFLNGYSNSKVPHTTRFRCLDKAAILNDNANSDERRNNPWLVSTITQVEEVKMVINLIPIWSTCILFWTVYSQMNTFTIEQASIMNRKLVKFNVPAGSFSVFLFISILLFTSLNERVIVPVARKITRDPKGLRSLQRVGIGLVFSVIGMIASAIVEKKRREMHQNEMKKLSAFWLVPQFFLVGAGEAFAYVGQLEFFIREAPESMKSMSTGLFLSSLAMGFFMSSVLVTLTDMATNGSWLTDNLNKGKLENFYGLLVILGFINFLVFLVLATRHRYKVQNFNGRGNVENNDIENCNITNTEMVDDIEGKKPAAGGKEEA